MAPWDPARTDILPVLGLVDRVLLPGMSGTVVLASVAAFGAAREATRSFGTPLLGAFSAQGCDDGLSSVGVLAAVSNLRKLDCGRWAVDLRGLGRARRHGFLRTEPFRLSPVECLSESEDDPRAIVPLVTQIRRLARRVAHPCSQELVGVAPPDLPGAAMSLLCNVSAADCQAVLEADTLEERLALVLAYFSRRSMAIMPASA